MFHEPYDGRISGHQEHDVRTRVGIQRKDDGHRAECDSLDHLAGSLVLEHSDTNEHYAHEQSRET